MPKVGDCGTADALLTAARRTPNADRMRFNTALYHPRECGRQVSCGALAAKTKFGPEMTAPAAKPRGSRASFLIDQSDEPAILAAALNPLTLLERAAQLQSIADTRKVTHSDVRRKTEREKHGFALSLVSSTRTNTVLKYDPQSGAPLGVFTPHPAVLLQKPQGIAKRSDGTIYVASYGSNQVLQYSATGGDETAYAEGEGLANPTGIVFDASDQLYVCNSAGNNILRWDQDGVFKDVFATETQLVNPQALAFDSTGRLCVCCFDGGAPFFVILRFLADGTFDTVFANLSITPRGLTIGPDNNVYVSAGEVQGKVLRYLIATQEYDSLFAIAGALTAAYGVVFGPDNNLYVCCGGSPPDSPSGGANCSVLRYNGTNGSFDKVFASGGGLNTPSGLAFV